MIIVSLLNLVENKTGRVVKIEGGHGIQKKLETLGIRNNVKIKKLSSQLMGGPIIINVGQTKIAIGRGIANKIIVETNE
ncbi:MAG TPA: ferrous iron transport protein A [Elusimicrobia bacterium]|nr:MAG: hypothetical protein A2551_05730 [Elusimicrobia bacterium RIFOXYD2_FULL_34_30]HAM39115.1 ferrous iron transport protein A [Elusimicrobiota bacterium]